MQSYHAGKLIREDDSSNIQCHPRQYVSHKYERERGGESRLGINVPEQSVSTLWKVT